MNSKHGKSAHQIMSQVAVLLLILISIAGCQSTPSTVGVTNEDMPVPFQPVNQRSLSVETAVSPTTAPVSAALTSVAAAETSETNECYACHTDRDKLIASATPDTPTIDDYLATGHWGAVDPMEPWEKVLIESETYPTTVHGLISCTDCHGGTQSPDKAIAHTGLVDNPSTGPQSTCANCHPNITALEQFSLHNTLAGFRTAIEARSVPANHPQLAEVMNNHCSACHATCGDCHVSQPTVVGGGLIDGHNFIRTPSMTRNCAACHGSRTGDEYLGRHEGLMGDVHFVQGGMTCVDCHSGLQLHGQPDDCQACHQGPEVNMPAPPNHRYAGVQKPRCETCHITVATGQDDIFMHQQHAGDLSCQVCHAIPYTSCDGCHVGVDRATGDLSYTLNAQYLTFMIGKNPLKSYDRPYDYVTLRHIPITKSSFAFYGNNLLINFDNQPTWAYATPHNIQRKTPQTATCYGCHGNADIFLTIDKLAPEEINANILLIVTQIPTTVRRSYPNVETLLRQLNEPEVMVTPMITNTEVITGTTP